MTAQPKHTPGPWRHDASYNVPVGPGDMPEKCPTTWISCDDTLDGIQLRFSTRATRESILGRTRLMAAAWLLPEVVEVLDGILNSGFAFPNTVPARTLLAQLSQAGIEPGGES